VDPQEEDRAADPARVHRRRQDGPRRRQSVQEDHRDVLAGGGQADLDAHIPGEGVPGRLDGQLPLEDRTRRLGRAAEGGRPGPRPGAGEEV